MVAGIIHADPNLELVWPPLPERTGHLEFFSTDSLPTPPKKRGVSSCPQGRCNHHSPHEHDYSRVPAYFIHDRAIVIAHEVVNRDRICTDRMLWESVRRGFRRRRANANACR